MTNNKLVFFDMDGVLIDVGYYEEPSDKIGVSTWRAIYEALGILDEDEKLKRKFEAGEFSSYMSLSDEACRVFQRHGLTEDKFLDVINSQKFMKGARETIDELKKRKMRTAVITGSFTTLAERAKKELGIDNAIAHCNLKFEEGKLSNWELNPCDYEGKVDAFLRLAQKNGVESSECIYVGDEVNDIPLFKKAGFSIAFNCNKQQVKAAASVVVSERDLRTILRYIPRANQIR